MIHAQEIRGSRTEAHAQTTLILEGTEVMTTLGRSSGFRIVLLVAPSRKHSHVREYLTVAYATFVLGYSGGTATELHRLPYSLVSNTLTSTHAVRES